MTISPAQLQQSLPVSLTTKADTRPVSVRTAPDNEIDQLNNTPNAKKLYNAKLIGGSIGAAIPLTAAVICLAKARTNSKTGHKLKAIFQTGLVAAGLYLTVGAAKVGSAVSNALTVFFSTRGKSKAE